MEFDPLVSNHGPVRGEQWFFLSTPVKKVRKSGWSRGTFPKVGIRGFGGGVRLESSIAPKIQGRGGSEGPKSRTEPVITAQPMTSNHNPWRIMDLRGMQPVP